MRKEMKGVFFFGLEGDLTCSVIFFTLQVAKIGFSDLNLSKKKNKLITQYSTAVM
jgi:hypothetical protein